MVASDRSDVDLAARVEQLTEKQRACLELVDDHATSKEIARRLGISRHTVDARLRGALQILGVSSRREAAIIYRAAAEANPYQSFTCQSSQIADSGSNTATSGHGDEQAKPDPAEGRISNASDSLRDLSPVYQASPQHVDVAPDYVADSAVWTFGAIADSAVNQPRFRLWGGSNDLTPAQRAAGIIVIAILAMLAFGTFLSGIEALTLLRS